MDEEQIVERQSAVSRRKKCGRRLSCGIHFCKKKKACEDCACPPCSAQITKKCRCGATTKRFKCHEYLARLRLEGADSWIRCSKKCKRLKTCGKHQCDEICCPGRTAKNFEGHQCLEVCNKLLRCGRHRCDSLCHYGACNPCDVLYADGFACRCGAVRVSEPFLCGTVHIPACTSTCDRELACGHRCSAKCGHSGACPPCVRLCSRPCETHGVMVPRMQCNVIQRFCSKACGKVLDCGIHVCRRKCHSGPCAEKWMVGCKQICDQPLRCGHECTARCHALDGDCNARVCKVQITVKCRCGESSEKQYCRGRTAKEIEAIACTDHCGDTERHRRYRAALSLQIAGNKQLLVYGYLGRCCRAKSVPRDIVRLICALHPNPVVYGFGDNTHFALGIGFKQSLAQFTRLEAMSSLLDFESDLYGLDVAHMIVDRLGNGIECAGGNESGLCLVDDALVHDVPTFTRYSAPIDLQSALVSTGTGYHVLMKDAQHVLHGFGDNHWCQLGDAKGAIQFECAYNLYTFRRLNGLNANLPLSLRQRIVSIVTGYGRTLLLLNDGRVFGLGSLPGTSTPHTRNANAHIAALSSPVHLDTLCDIRSIACGGGHNVFVDAHNHVFVNGSNNENGELGLGVVSFGEVVTPTRIEALEYDRAHDLEVHCGEYHTMIIDRTAQDAMTFGFNNYGQIGHLRGSAEAGAIPTPYAVAKENNLKVAHGAAGDVKTLIVTPTNELYWCGYCGSERRRVFGDNDRLERVWTPTLVPKHEIGIADTDQITRVVAGLGTVLVIVNQE